MPRSRPRNRSLTIIATITVAAVVVAPAAVSAVVVDHPVQGGVDAKRIAHTATSTERLASRAGKAVDKIVAAQGPFVPVIGPVDYGTAENRFGAARSGHVHAGQDMFAKPGTPEVAVTDGVIAETGSDSSQGNFVYLYDPQRDRAYVYMHMIEPAKVQSGDRVDAGQLLGGLGCTGSCWGDHLHFEIRDGRGIAGEAHDPLPELKRWESLRKPR
jgi:murein DD-endopeptidase MepM/ murein hydrolase activator NlpD